MRAQKFLLLLGVLEIINREKLKALVRVNAFPYGLGIVALSERAGALSRLTAPAVFPRAARIVLIVKILLIDSDHQAAHTADARTARGTPRPNRGVS